MAAPTFVAWTNTAGATLAEPTGTAAGDTILAIVNSTTTPTGPSGWSQIGSSRTVGGEIATAWSIVRGGSAPALTWSGSIDGGLLTTIRGAASTFEATAQSAAGSAVSPSVTTTVADCLIVSLYADSGSTSITAPSGMTLTDGFFDASAYVAQAVAGASGTKTWGGTSVPIGAWTVALKPNGLAFTGSGSATVTASGNLVTGMTGTAAVTASGAGALSLGVTMGGAGSATVTASGTLTAISRVFVGTLEIEFTAGVWTDVTSRMALARSALTVRQGRATEFDDVGGGVLNVVLFNDDGALMPDNSGSAYYPNVVEGKRIRWKITKAAVTYTRFVGWITAWVPDFPSGSTTGATVAITASDALGLLALRRLRSNWTERALAVARAASTTVDALEATGQTSGWVAAFTNYSTDAGASRGGYGYSGQSPNLSFGTDRDVSIGQVAVCSPDTVNSSNKTLPAVQSSRSIQWLLKTPTTIPTGATQYVISSPHPAASSATGIQIVIESNGGGGARLSVYDVGVTTNLGVLKDPAPVGQWVLITLKQNAGNVARLDVVATDLGTGTVDTVSNVNFDVRTIGTVEFPNSTGATTNCALGGIVACGANSPLSYVDATPVGAQGTLSTRLDKLIAACAMLPVAFTKVGSLATQVLTGQWDRYALDVLQEMMRSNQGLAWARSRDSQIMLVDAASCRPASPIATIDTDADCAGVPRLSRVVETRPTRIQVDTPAGSKQVVDATAEAGPGNPQRSKTVATVNASMTDAVAVGTALLAASTSLRITQLTIDLTTGVTDHTAALFSESGALTGLFPTCRIRTTLPVSHFGVTSRDHYVQGWTETYTPTGVRVAVDTTPAP